MSTYFNRLRRLLLLLMFLQAGCNTTFKAEQIEALFRATEKGSIKEVEALIAQGVDVNAQNSSGQRALHTASSKGHADIVKLLLAQPRVNINAISGYNTTPLDEAVNEGHVDIVKLLLAQPGINVNDRNTLKYAQGIIRKLLQDALKAKKLGIKQIHENVYKAKPAIVYISSKQGSGSGVIVDPQGYVITNSHVLPHSKNSIIYVLTIHGRYTAQLVHRDETKDLALIKLQKVGKVLPYLPLGDSGELLTGDPVFAFGFVPTLLHRTYEPVFVTKAGKFVGGSINLRHDAETIPGMSGGPVLDRYGNLIGINCAGEELKIGGRWRYYTLHGTSSAISSNTVQSFLQEGKEHFQAASSHFPDETAQLQEKLLEKVRHATVRIRVSKLIKVLEGKSVRNALRYSLAAGIIIDPRGYVITNSHVIPKSRLTIDLIADTGEEYYAKLVSRDKTNDLALLKVSYLSKRGNLPHLEFGDLAKLKNGDQVFALGHPDGKLVCWCSPGECALEANLIKHDAELFPKMDGGPLVDIEGNLIGIHKSRKKNKSRFWPFGKRSTKNVAISAEVVKQFFEKTKKIDPTECAS